MAFKGLTCIECDRKFSKLYPDHREPPLEIGDCLCSECAIAHIEEQMEEVQNELDHLTSLQAKIEADV